MWFIFPYIAGIGSGRVAGRGETSSFAGVGSDGDDTGGKAWRPQRDLIATNRMNSTRSITNRPINHFGLVAARGDIP